VTSIETECPEQPWQVRFFFFFEPLISMAEKGLGIATWDFANRPGSFVEEYCHRARMTTPAR